MRVIAILTALVLSATAACALFGASEREQIAKTAADITRCQNEGRACQADGGKGCYDVYDACMADAGLR